MTVTDPARLAALVESTACVLLDFDGPVCSVFAGVPAPVVADALRQRIADDTGVPDAIPAEVDDPLVVFKLAADRWPDQAGRFHQQLTDAETDAIRLAAPTPGTLEFLTACQASDRPVAIVSNNGRPAIDLYLKANDLDQYVAHIEARVEPDPALMKPHPHLVQRAVEAMKQTPDECVLIGDSVTDIQAAHAAGVPAIGYANKPAKLTLLADVEADAIVTDMRALAEVFGS